jgi:hypothetical protein
MFPIKNGWKQGAVLSRFLYNFAFDYEIRRFQINGDGLKLNGTHTLLVYAADVIILGGRVRTAEKNVKPLVVATEEIGLQVNADKSKCMAISRDRNG